jgi:alcohol dehydrogenase class IV
MASINHLTPVQFGHGAIQQLPAELARPGLRASGIAIPTTAGTGAEVGRAAVIVMADGHQRTVVSMHLPPRSAICDPEMTRSLPPRLTAGIGLPTTLHQESYD